MMRKKSVAALAALLMTTCAVPAAHAATVMNSLGTLMGSMTETGTLTSETQVVEESFTLASMGNLTAYTTSYGGGSNLNGTTTAAGGFQSMLTLYNAAGDYVMSEAAMSPVAKMDPATGIAGDAYLMASNLMAGNYILVLTDWQNQQSATATNLSDGFSGPGGTSFMDVMGNVRTGNYALNLSTMSSTTATPEPATFWMAMAALFGGMLVARNRMKAVRTEA